MLFNQIYDVNSSDVSGFWSELNVNYDFITEMDNKKKKDEVRHLLYKLSVDSLEEISILEKIDIKKKGKESYLKALEKNINKDKFLLVHNFSKRKNHR